MQSLRAVICCVPPSARSTREDFSSFIVCFWTAPSPGFVLSLARPVRWGEEAGLETDRCSGVWCLTRSRSMRSSQRGDEFDSSDSLTMITLSWRAGEGQGRAHTQHFTRRLKWNPHWFDLLHLLCLEILLHFSVLYMETTSKSLQYDACNTVITHSLNSNHFFKLLFPGCVCTPALQSNLLLKAADEGIHQLKCCICISGNNTCKKTAESWTIGCNKGMKKRITQNLRKSPWEASDWGGCWDQPTTLKYPQISTWTKSKE